MGGPSLGRRPILLARLPQVGQSVVIAESKPALAIVSEELPVESSAHERPASSYFIDPGHQQPSAMIPPVAQQTAEHKMATSATRSRKKLKRQSSSGGRRSSKFSSRAPQPTGLAAIFCHLHAQIAPFAGAIVALALVAAAGLVYLMLLSPTQPSSNDSGVGSDDWSLTSVEIPSFVPRATPSPIQESPGQATLLPKEQEFQTAPPMIAWQKAPEAPLEVPPVLNTPVEQVPTVAAWVYPPTIHPTALDFSQVSAAGKGGLLEPVTVSAVAHWPTGHVPAPNRR